MGCAGSGPERPRAYVYRVPLDVTFDLARGQVLTEADEARHLKGPNAPRLVFLGEHHADPRSRTAQLRWLRLLREGGRSVTVALEMFPPQADAALEAWRLGKLSEVEFVEQSKWYETWGFPWRSYRELFLWIREGQIPVRGLNADEVTRVAVRENKVETLSPALREEVGDLEEVAPHRDYLLDTLRGASHGSGGGASLSPDAPAFQRMQRVQTLWDRLMGLRAARLAEAQPSNGVVVVILGSGHVAYGLGAPLHAARASTLRRLSVWDAVVLEAELDAQGRAVVPVGTADWVRVYPDQELPVYPALRGIKLAADSAGVKVEAIRIEPENAGQSPVGEEDVRRVLRAGDVIQVLNAERIASVAALRFSLEGLPWGEAATFTLLRNGRTEMVKFKPRPPAKGS
jgi:uncharacterized iron-regulated protein